MKKLLACACFTMLTLGLFQNTFAQQSKAAGSKSPQLSKHKTFDEVFTDPNKLHPSLKKDLSILLVPLVAKIETEKKKYNQPGELSFFALLEDVPSPVYTLSKAKSVDAPRLYDPYLEQVDRAARNFAATYSKHNKNENVSSKKVVRTDLNNPSAPMGKAAHNAAMNKLMQDMIKDPKLAARFEKMSEAEKETFMKPYFKENIPRDDAAFEKTMAERNEAKGTFNLTQLVQETGQEIYVGKEQYKDLKRAIDSTFEDQYKKVEIWFQERYQAIPTIVVGEGHDKDPKQLSGLYKARSIILYNINEKHAELLAEAWYAFKAKSKQAIGKFDAFVGNYKWDSQNNNAEQGLLGGVQEVYGLMGDLTAEARAITMRSKKWQLDFEAQSIK